MTPEELKEIEERCNKATPNPILTRYDHGGGRSYVPLPSGGIDLVADYYGEGPDREFYYHSREDIPKLLSYIKELESQIPQWIPVEERLPENCRGTIFIYSKKLGVLPEASYKDGYWYWDMDIVEDVTHWQPFPKGPEE